MKRDRVTYTRICGLMLSDAQMCQSTTEKTVLILHSCMGVAGQLAEWPTRQK